MWARMVELALGVWLSISPFLFASGGSSLPRWEVYAAALAVVGASCLSYWPPTRHARGVTGGVGLWLAARAYFAASYPAFPMDQNVFLVGLLLIMFAVVPSEAGRPPESWRRLLERRPA